MTQIIDPQEITDEEFLGERITMNKRIPQPSPILTYCLVALCAALHLISIILIVTHIRQWVDRTEQILEAKSKPLSMAMNYNIGRVSEADSRTMEKIKTIESSVNRDSDMMAKLEKLQLSVDRVLSDDLLGSFTSDFQRILIAISELRKGATKGNGTADPLCNKDWTHYGVSCYYKSSHLRAWQSAKKDCEERSAQLVVINTAEEMIKIKETRGSDAKGQNQYMSSAPPGVKFLQNFIEQSKSWIGLSDADGKWKWVDETSYDITPKFWALNQPDSQYGRGEGEACVQLINEFEWEINGWNVARCPRQFTFVCEKKIL
ncbi:asialoglycoprotein receptor 1-like [Gastrophryne carolinensis]